jgi:hypothetical protein
VIIYHVHVIQQHIMNTMSRILAFDEPQYLAHTIIDRGHVISDPMPYACKAKENNSHVSCFLPTQAKITLLKKFFICSLYHKHERSLIRARMGRIV